MRRRVRRRSTPPAPPPLPTLSPEPKGLQGVLSAWALWGGLEGKGIYQQSKRQVAAQPSSVSSSLQQLLPLPTPGFSGSVVGGGALLNGPRCCEQQNHQQVATQTYGFEQPAAGGWRCQPWV